MSILPMESNEQCEKTEQGLACKDCNSHMKRICCRRAVSLCKTVVLVGLGAVIALSCVQCCKMHHHPKP